MNNQKKDPMEWEVLESEYLYKRPWLTARREHVKLPTGAEIQDFYVLEYPEFCNVIAITKDVRHLIVSKIIHINENLAKTEDGLSPVSVSVGVTL